MSGSMEARRRAAAKLWRLIELLEAEPGLEERLWRRPEVRRAVRRAERALAATTRREQLS